MPNRQIVEPSEVKRFVMVSGSGNKAVVQKRVVEACVKAIQFRSSFAGADVGVTNRHIRPCETNGTADRDEGGNLHREVLGEGVGIVCLHVRIIGCQCGDCD